MQDFGWTKMYHFLDPGWPKGPCPPPPGPVKISHKKLAAEGDSIVFMFLAPPPPPLTRPLVRYWSHSHYSVWKNTHADGNVKTLFLEIIRLHFFRKIICAMIYLANYRVKC